MFSNEISLVASEFKRLKDKIKLLFCYRTPEFYLFKSFRFFSNNKISMIRLLKFLLKLPL